MMLGAVAGCASTPPVTSSLFSRSVPTIPQAQGSYYEVRPGDTLWGIAHDFGWDATHLARLNRITDAAQVTVGQRLFIPPPPTSKGFIWPVRGTVTPVSGSSVRGVEIQAPEGSFVRAARTGLVAVAARQLQGWGHTVILDHGDGYVSVYAGMEHMLVNPGMSIQQGNPVGRVGRAPLYFEIRRGTAPQNPFPLLP
ncbi:MAG: peptidoglycan DD-metalloendopeptidase family protein [Candidatus Omnitrophica bacterium]|nr:peptidoglycan DD-metalloendopeptidase family protein [Candidatus Omnitrophota bacterium]